MEISEDKLIEELKLFCKERESKWEEVNSNESAKVLRKLGLLHRNKCLDEKRNRMDRKISFIHSAALLNASFVRNTLPETKKDLQNLCFELLRVAGANDQKFDLVEFSSSLKKKIKDWRAKLREDVKKITTIPDKVNIEDFEKLEQKKVDEVETIQTQVTEIYKSLMVDVSNTCISVLGEVPCRYALVGMGSMARKEITPYSDFENLILLKEGVQFREKNDYENVKEYFRWFAVIFYVILINLGETILPSVAIPSLNDFRTDGSKWFFDKFTKRGICFDGMMPHASKNALGRQQSLENKPWKTELIKPVSQMVQYLDREEDRKDGYHLADILTCTCFVAGDRSVYLNFAELVKKASSDSKKEAIEIVKKDMETYNTKLNISTTIDYNSYNVKQFIYRSTTVFIAGLAKIFGITPGSSFEMVRTISKMNLITELFKNKLLYALAIACEIRLKTYLDIGCQDECIESFSSDNKDIAAELIKIVGKQSCYDYFEIACCLQYDAIAQLELSREYMYYHPVTMCITISSFLRLYHHIVAAKQYVVNHVIFEDQPDVDEFYDGITFNNVDCCDSNTVDDDNNNTRGFENCENDDLSIQSVIEETEDNSNNSQSECSKEIAYNDSSSNCIGLDIEIATEEVSTTEGDFDRDDDDIKRIVGNEFFLGSWYRRTQEFARRFQQYRRSELEYETATEDLIELGEHFFTKGVYLESLDFFKIAIMILQAPNNRAKKYRIAHCFRGIAKCLCRQKKYKEAIRNFKEALTFPAQKSDEKQNANFMALNYKDMAFCKSMLGRKDQACEYYKKALELFDMTSEGYDNNVSSCLHQFGHCLHDQKQFEDAAVQYKKLLDFISAHGKSEATVKTETFKGWITYYVGVNLQKSGSLEDSLKTFQDALAILRNDIIDPQKVEEINAKCWFAKGDCHASLGQHLEAIESFQKSAQLWKKLTFFGNKQYFLKHAACYEQISLSFKAGCQYQQAIANCLKSFEILKNATELPLINYNLSRLRKLLGAVYTCLGQHEEAYYYYCEALSIHSAAQNNRQEEAILHKKCSSSLFKLGKSDKATEHVKKALEINQLLLQAEPANISLLKEIGICYRSLNDSKSAICYLQNYIDSLGELNQNNADVALTLKNVGMCLQKERKWTEAVRYFQRSREKYKALPKNTEFEKEMAFLNNNIGKHYSLNDEPQKAKECFESTVTWCSTQGKFATEQVNVLHAYALEHLGHLNKNQKFYNEAVCYYAKAKLLYMEMTKTDRNKFKKAMMYKNIGLCYNGIQNCHFAAFDSFDKSFQILESLPRTLKRIEEISFVLKNIGFILQYWCLFDKAYNCFSKSLEEYRTLPSSDRKRTEVEYRQDKIEQCLAHL